MTPETSWPAAAVSMRPLAELKPRAQNPRLHDERQVEQLAASIREWGWTTPVLVDEAGEIIAGHGRVLAAEKLGLLRVPCMVARGWSEAQRRAYVIADNQLALAATWDQQMLKVEACALDAAAFDTKLLGFDDIALAKLLHEIDPATPGALAAKFGVPPFSVLNAREGWWQQRKAAWLALGIRSEVGRDAPPGGSLMPAADYQAAKASGNSRQQRKPLATTVAETDWIKRGTDAGGSIFDPVLCELAYSWFCPRGGLVLDPFAGGSVRGIVAGKLGRFYMGVDLRQEQVDANNAQGDAIVNDRDCLRWICGDSRDLAELTNETRADFLFSCPPYADLEVYSDDPRDLSTLPYPSFRNAYFEIIGKACAQLKDDRFAAFVVGEVRGPDGAYYDFIGDTVQAFRSAGLAYYNEAIFVTPLGSLPIRAGRQFSASRKLGKTHQNLLVFCKGDPLRAVEACGEVEVDVPLGEPQTLEDLL